jgi:toxin HigB-1
MDALSDGDNDGIAVLRRVDYPVRVEIEFDDPDLDRLEVEAGFTAGHGHEVVRGFRKAIAAIRAATDERDLYTGGLQFEKLKGSRKDDRSIRINKQWRLIVEIRSDGTRKRIAVVRIEDYH